MNDLRWIYVIGTRNDNHRYPSIRGLFGRVLGEDKIFPGQLLVQFFTDRQKDMDWFAFTDNIYPEDVRPATKEEIDHFLSRLAIENEELPKASPYWKLKSQLREFTELMERRKHDVQMRA